MRGWRLGAGLLVIVLVMAGGWRLLAQDDPEYRVVIGERDYQGPSLQVAEQGRTLESLAADVEQLAKDQQTLLDDRKKLRETIAGLERRVKALEQGHSSEDQERYFDDQGNPLPSRMVTIERYLGHRARVKSVAISPDGHWGASTDENGTLRVWDLRTHEAHDVFSFTENGWSLGAIAFSPDGKFLIVTGLMEVRLLEVRSWDVVWSDSASRSLPRVVAFSRNGDLVALPAGDVIEMRDAETGRVIEEVSIAQDIVLDVAFGPSGDELFVIGVYSGNGATPITYFGRLWNWKTGEERFRVNYPLEGVEWDVDRGRIYLIGARDSIEEWDAKSGERLRTWEETDPSGKYGMMLSGDGRYLAVGLYGAVELWDTRTAERLEHVDLPVPEAMAEYVACNDNGSHVLVGDPTAETIWGTYFRTPRQRRWKKPPQVSAHADASSEATTSGSTPGDEMTPITRLARQETPICSFAISPDGRHLYTASLDLGFCKWDRKTGRRLASDPDRQTRGRINEISCSREGDRILTYRQGATASRGMLIWDARNWEVLRTLSEDPPRDQGPESEYQNHIREKISAAAIDPGGRVAASAHRTRMIRLWDVESGELLATLKGPVRGASDVTFSPDGKFLAAVGRDGIWLWEVESRQLLGRVPARPHANWIGGSIVFSPQTGNLLVPNRLGSQEVRIGDQLASRTIIDPPEYEFPITSAIYSPNGELILAGAHGRAFLFDADTGQELASVPSAAFGTSLAFTADGNRFMTAGEENAVVVWPVPEGDDAVTAANPVVAPRRESP